MERKVLLFGLLQSLSLFTSARSDFNGTSTNNCIDIDMANIEEYTSTLKTLESPALNASFVSAEDRKSLRRFGALKTDWTRLQLLHEALPRESVLKRKFKHLFRLLLIAHDQASQLTQPSGSTKPQYTVSSETTPVSVTIKKERTEEIDKSGPIADSKTLLNSTDLSQQVGEALKDFSTGATSVDSFDEIHTTLRSSVANLITTSPKYTEDGVDAAGTKNAVLSMELDTGDKTAVKSDFADIDAPSRLSTIPVSSYSTSDMSATDKNFYDIPINVATTLITGQPRESSNFGHTKPVSNAEIISNSTHVTSSIIPNAPLATVVISQLDIEPFKNKINSTKEKYDPVVGLESSTSFDANVTAAITEIITKEEFDTSTAREEYSAVTSSNTMTMVEGYSLNSTLRGKDLNWTRKEGTDTLSNETSTENVLMKETSASEEYFLAVTASSSVPTLSQPLSTTSREDIVISTNIKNNIGSPAQSAVTARSKEQNSSDGDYSSAATVSSYETTRDSSFISTQIDERLVVSTRDETLLAKLATTTIPAKTLETNKTLLWVRNITSDGANDNGSLLSETPSQSTPEVQSAYERVSSSPIQELSTTSSSAKVHTDENVWLSMNSTDSKNASLGKMPNNEEIKQTSFDDNIEFITSEKSPDNKQDSSSSTARPTSALSTSTLSANTRRYVDQQSTTTIVAKEKDLPRDGKRVNKTNTSEDELATEKIDYRVPNSTGTSSTSRPTFTFGNSTLSARTRPYVDQQSTTMIVAKGKDLPRDGKHINKTGISKDEPTIGKIDQRLPNNTGTSMDEPAIGKIDHRLSNNTGTSKDEPVLEKIDHRLPNNTGTSKDEPAIGKIDHNLPNNTRTSKDEPAIGKIDHNLPNNTGTSKDEPAIGKIDHRLLNNTGTSKDEPAIGKIDHHLRNNTETSSIRGSTPIPISSTLSVSTRRYVDQRSTTMIVAEEKDFPSEKSEDALKATVKPIYVKNPLHAGSSRSNHISRDFKHGSANVGTDKKSESQEIILYESGSNAKNGNVWRPHIVREQPAGNNIRRFDKFSQNSRPYGYQRSSSPAVTNAKTDNSAKWPFHDKTNLSKSRKRGSANADIEKQFRWFYRQGEIDPSNKSRSNDNVDPKIKIQCKNSQ